MVNRVVYKGLLGFYRVVLIGWGLLGVHRVVYKGL